MSGAVPDAPASLVLPGIGRFALLSCDLVRDLHFVILETYADAAQDVLYRTGYEWALQSMVARPPAAAAPGTTADDISARIGAWWSAFRTAGWGELRRIDVLGTGRYHVELQGSAVAESLGRADDPVCHLFAGLFAGAFSFLDHAERHGVEIQCRSTGGESCRFVIGPAADIDRSETLRQQGTAPDDIMNQFSGTETSAGDAVATPGHASERGPEPAAMLTDSGGRRVVGAAAPMLRSLWYVLERERAGSWATVSKSAGRMAGRKLGADRDADLARRGQPALAAQPMPAAMQPIESWFAEYGWGRLTVDGSGAEEYGLIVGLLAHSCFAELLRDAASLADPLPAGMLQGYFEHITGQTLAAEEIACARDAAVPCTFAVSTPDRLAPIVPLIGREPASQILARLRS